jgi:hypothetical protein
MNYKQIYTTLRNDTDAELYRKQLLEGKVSTANFQPEQYADAIGSFDATSCLGCIFTANDGQHVVSFHHDGRKLGNLLPLFEAYKGQVVQLDITGGVQARNNKGELANDYSLVEKESTIKNFETLIDFSRKLPCKVELKSWTIGDESNKEGLVSEYLAKPERKVTLLETGSIHGKCLPPEFVARYSLNSLIQKNGVAVVFDATVSDKLTLKLPLQSRLNYRGFANNIKNTPDDALLLKEYSTTPELEPPYFCDTMRKASDFFLSAAPQINYNPELPKDSPCVILQGEAGRICKVAKK